MADEVHAAWLKDHRDQSNGALAVPARDRRDTVETTKALDSADLKPCRVMILRSISDVRWALGPTATS